MRNNPVRYTDPSGNRTCEDMPWECDDNGNWPTNQDSKPGSCASDRIIITLNGQECVLIPVGDWKITKYIYSLESDKVSPDIYTRTNDSISVPVCGHGFCSDRILSFRFLFGAEGLAMQGTGFTRTGEVIRVGDLVGKWVYTNQGYIDYYHGTAKFEWGYGGPGYAMTAYMYGAVGPNYKNGTYYVPLLQELGINQSGIVYGFDSGGRVGNQHLDVFVGIGLAASNRSPLPSTTNNVPVFRIICKGNRTNVD
jgi:hypothetical protein